MTADDFTRVAAALYGGARGWQTALADATGIHPRTINRVAAGAVEVSPRLARALVDVADRRLAEVTAAAKAARDAAG